VRESRIHRAPAFLVGPDGVTVLETFGIDFDDLAGRLGVDVRRLED